LKIIVVSEDLYDDFAKACQSLKAELAKPDSHRRLTDPYLPITQLVDR